jgi:hypothetical protein
VFEFGTNCQSGVGITIGAIAEFPRKSIEKTAVRSSLAPRGRSA